MSHSRRERNPRCRRMYRLRLGSLLFLSRRKRKDRTHARLDCTQSDCGLKRKMFALNYEISNFCKAHDDTFAPPLVSQAATAFACASILPACATAPYFHIAMTNSFPSG